MLFGKGRRDTWLTNNNCGLLKLSPVSEKIGAGMRTKKRLILPEDNREMGRTPQAEKTA